MSEWKRALGEIRKQLQSPADNVTKRGRTKRVKPGSIADVPSAWRDATAVTKGAEVDRRRPAHPPANAPGRPTSPIPPLSAVTQSATPACPAPDNQAIASAMRPMGIPRTLCDVKHTSFGRQKYYKAPDSWVAAGARTQLTASGGAPPVDIVVGVDFGTSYTKAAVGMRDRIYPVSWEGISGVADRYLLPTEYSVLNDGSSRIGQAPDIRAEQLRQRLKQPFINPAVSSASIADAAVFVAWVLRYVRAWIFHYHADKLGASTIRWLLNIGAPSNGLETGELKVSYQRLTRVAWALSLGEPEIRPAQAREMAAAPISGTRLDHLLDFEVLPEFVAQIAGYVQSAQRRSGLHMLADVGGGTLDVVTFIVHERDGEDAFPFLVPDVRALGTQMLNQNRLVGAPPFDETDLPDELQPVVSVREFAIATGLSEAHVHQRDQLIWRAVHETVHNVLYKTKLRRYRLANAWKEGLPIFLTGGGSAVEGYTHSVRSGGARNASRLILMPLPVHPRLTDFSGGSDEYQRISVACGLAQDPFSLGQIIPAKDVDDDIAPCRSAAERQDRDDLYPH